MSSHREAPQIAKDPVADSTDVYAFRSPDVPNTVTLLANYIPLQALAGGPNFYEFGDDVTYDINIDNTGSGTPNITYRFVFTTTNTNPDTFLYNTGPITSLTDSTWNRRQTYTLTRLDYTDGNPVPTSTTSLGTHPCPPCNIGPLSTPDYPNLGGMAMVSFSGGSYTGRTFAGQRAEAFYVDLGTIFDLGVLRPIQALHNTFGLKNTGLGAMAEAVNATARVNVHTLALQIPITQLTSTGTAPTSVTANGSVIGVWTAASRPTTRTYEGPSVNSGEYETAGALVQVSRLGNPLVNEVLIPLAKKDAWNATTPSGDSAFTSYFTNPELAQLLPVLYPGALPNLAKYNSGTVNRADIEAILLTGLPSGIIPGFQNHLASTGVTADMLRLNVAVPPAKKPNVFGILGGDLAGFPNGRRIFDDIVTIELRALAGATLPLVDTKYKADAAIPDVSQGLTNSTGTKVTATGSERYKSYWPYLGVPYGGAYIGTPLPPRPEMTDDDTTAAVPPPDDAAVASGGLDGAAVTAPSRWYDMSRRGFLRNGSIGVAAAGVAASVPGLGSLLAAGESDAPAIQGSATEAEGDASGVSQGVMAKVDNLSTGEMRLFVGNQTIAVSDPQLAQRISQAVRAGQAAGLGHT